MTPSSLCKAGILSCMRHCGLHTTGCPFRLRRPAFARRLRRGPSRVTYIGDMPRVDAVAVPQRRVAGRLYSTNVVPRWVDESPVLEAAGRCRSEAPQHGNAAAARMADGNLVRTG